MRGKDGKKRKSLESPVNALKIDVIK